MGRFVEWPPRAERSYEGRPHARHITTAVRVLVLALYAHGYLEVNGKVFDVSSVDPSMASAAGAHALITTGGDLVRFLDALLAGRLFRRLETLRQMLTFAHSPRRRRPCRLRPRARATRPARWHRADRPSRRGGWLLRLRRPDATPKRRDASPGAKACLVFGFAVRQASAAARFEEPVERGNGGLEALGLGELLEQEGLERLVGDVVRLPLRRRRRDVG